jgi:hypothetical protein
MAEDPTAPIETPIETTTETPEFPKPLVRLTPGISGYDADVRMAADADAVTALEGAGYVAVPFTAAPKQEYPKWVFHEDGRRRIVSNHEEHEQLDGFTEAPPAPKDDDPYKGQVPPPVGDAAPMTTSTRGPVPVDRG